MTEPAADATIATDAVDELRRVAELLSGLVAADPAATADGELTMRSERAISRGVALLATSRAEAAAAIEAGIVGAAPRPDLALARDLALTVELVTRALAVTLASDVDGVRTQ